MQQIIIKNGTIVNSTHTQKSDLLISDGKIQLIQSPISSHDSSTQVIDATDCLILPGGIDPHVHMQLPIGNNAASADDFLSGSRAAIAGGTTTIIDFVTPTPGQSLREAVDIRKKEAQQSLCNHALHLSVTQWTPNTPREMKTISDEEGIHSVKVYMAYKKTVGLDDSDILKVMDTASQIGMTVMVHCEHGETIDYLQQKFIAQGCYTPRYHPLSRPPEVEAEAVKRAIMMAKATGCKLYIVHVSTKEAVEEIQRAREQGLPVEAETCPHYLVLDEKEYQRSGFQAAAYIMSPPLRSIEHQTALWDAIQKGIIQTVSTDHCPFNMKERETRGSTDFTKIPNGVPGVEHRLQLLYHYGVLQNRITIQQFVDLVSTSPARCFHLYPHRGIIAPQAQADIVIWDPYIKNTISAKTHHHHCDTSIYEGFEVTGAPRTVIINGTIFQ